MAKRSFFSALILTLLTSNAINPAYSQPWKTVADLPAYISVSNQLYRGGQPSVDGLRQLKEKGIKTIISLRNNKQLTEQESAEAQKLGIKFISIPMNGIQKPSATEIEIFLHTVGDKESQPVFVHCEEGVDRTGTMVGIYRIATDHWTAKRAYEEMLKRGFHPIYAWLADSVFDFEEHYGKPSKGRPWGAKIIDTLENAKTFFSLNHNKSKGAEHPLG
ncbi:MAG TPA: dual specificity protein phosphatase family protein [Oculatellaceae cyanobacterium]